MPLATISLRRPLGSYAKAQALVGRLIRNRRFQLRRERVRRLARLDVGCGPNLHEQLINLDYLWRPGVDVCWDISRGLPFPGASLQGVFSEHCLEHFPLPGGLALLREMRRVLVPGGTVRIVVPDGELYLLTYASRVAGGVPRKFPYEEAERNQPLWTPMSSVNRIFYQDRESLAGHRTIFDLALMSAALSHCGFTRIERCQFRQGRDPVLLIDTPERQIESLYVEASAG
jgi:predicted SAM-dependent methyltransferase